MGRQITDLNGNVITGFPSDRTFVETGSIAKSDFAVVADLDAKKKIILDPTLQTTNTTLTLKSPAITTDVTITLPLTSGTLLTTSTDNAGFSIIQPITGTSPTATTPTSTLTLTSSDSSIYVAGVASTNTIDLKGVSPTTSIGITIDGGGLPLTTGVKGALTVPYACTINSWTVLADQSGSIVLDIWKVALASYPPTVTNTITASAKPTLSSADHNSSSTLTGWTTSISAGDTIKFNVDSISTITRITLSLKVTKS